MDPSKLKDLLKKSISYLANAAASIDNPTSSNNSTSTNNRPTSQLLALSDSIDTKKEGPIHPAEPDRPAQSQQQTLASLAASDFRNSFPGLHGIRPGEL